MNKEINFSIPVTLYDFRESDNPLYSFAKLKIFYVGETGDRRLFTKEFSDKLLKTLPYVPVVGYYNEEEGDFEGHKQEIQHIYGMVPEDTEIAYVEEDGREYAVCDIILYTGRKDRTGEIASKIIGKQHSLELNPDNVTYKVNKDSRGKIKNIEFTGGSLLGLSVLGDDETPAFDGSGFFNEDSELMEIFMGFKSQIKEFASHIKQRGEDMNEKVFESALSFLKKTYSEKMMEMYSKLEEIYGGCYIIQAFDDNVVVEVWNEQEMTSEYIRLDYSENEEGEIVFGEPVSVFPRFLTKEEATIWENNVGNGAENESFDGEEEDDEEDNENYTEGEVETDPNHSDSDSDEEDSELNSEEGDFNDGEEENPKTDEDNKNFTENDTSLENSGEGSEPGTEDSGNFSSNSEEGTEDEEEEEEEGTQEEQNFSTALTDSEREELEAFRRERKEKLIDSFEDDLSKKFLKELKNEVDGFSFDELEVILSKEFTKISRENRNKNTKPNAFVYNSQSNKPMTEAERVQMLVEKYK